MPALTNGPAFCRTGFRVKIDRMTCRHFRTLQRRLGSAHAPNSTPARTASSDAGRAMADTARRGGRLMSPPRLVTHYLAAVSELRS